MNWNKDKSLKFTRVCIYLSLYPMRKVLYPSGGILLSPKDLFNIAKKFGITPKAALTQYCEAYIRCNSFPGSMPKTTGNYQTLPAIKKPEMYVWYPMSNRQSVPCSRLAGILRFLPMATFRKI